MAYKAGTDLVHAYSEQILNARHQRQPRLDTLLGVRLNGPVPPAVLDAAAATFNGVSLPMTWKSVEPTESQYKWESVDVKLAWAAAKRGGDHRRPAHRLPPARRTAGLAVALGGGTLPSLSSFMCDYVETAVGRYHKVVRRWHRTAASNVTEALKLSEDDLLWVDRPLGRGRLAD